MPLARVLYSIFVYCCTPLIVLRLLWRALRAPAYAKRWRERWGFVPARPAKESLIWLHSVSVGETLAAIPLIKALQTTYPQTHIHVTCMTPTASVQIQTALSDYLGRQISHTYAPYDSPSAVARFLRRINPAIFIVMETELWPNMLASCQAQSIPVVLANARLSLKSASGYAQFLTLTKPMLSGLCRVAAQTPADAARFIALGSPTRAVTVTGNIKFDLALSAELIAKAAVLRGHWQGKVGRPIWLVASTHPGEEALLLTAFKAVKRAIPNVLMVLTPRHPERFNAVFKQSVSAGYRVVRASDGVAPSAQSDVLVGDTMGQLLLYYGACDVAFVGGSLVPVGGHNMIEPAAWGRPIICGPQLHNFMQVATLLEKAGGLQICDDVDQLSATVIDVLGSEEKRLQIGSAALQVAQENRGALQKILTIIDGVPF